MARKTSKTATKLTNADIASIVTAQIIDAMRAGTAPWVKPWSASKYQHRLPTSFATKKAYRGINSIVLSMQPYQSPYWLTYKQASELGGNVKKGESSTRVVFWKFLKQIDRETGEEKKIAIMKLFYLFNVEQCEGLTLPKWAMPQEKAKDYATKSIKTCEAIWSGYENGPTLKHEGDRAFYRPFFDDITMPAKKQFKKPDLYYHTLFHESIHSTGHTSRLAREFGTAFGNEKYSQEELIAELGASFLSAEAGIDYEVKNAASYVKHWLSFIESGDEKTIVAAASAAQKAVDRILGRKFDNEDSNEVSEGNEDE